MKEIKLTQNKVTFVDDEDFDKVNAFKWYATKIGKNYYAIRQDMKTRKRVYMHRYILTAIKGMDVDHKDGNGLNNQKQNLRLCSRQQNISNTRKHRGALPYKGLRISKNGYQAVIRVNGVRHYLGLHGTAVCAALAYDEAAIKFYGEFANLNFPTLKRST